MIRTILVLLVVFAGLSAAVLDSFAGLLLYLWFAFFRPQEWVWTDITSLRLSLVIAATFVVRSLVGGKFPNVTHPISLALIALLTAAIGAELTTPLPPHDLQWLTQVAQTALIVLLLVTHVDSASRLRVVAIVLTCSLGFHTVQHGLTMLLSPDTRVAQGVAGAFADNNSYAVVCAMIAMLLVALGLTFDRRWLRWGFFTGGALSTLTVIATFSRGGFLSIASAILVFSLARRIGVKWFAAAAVAGVLALPFVELPSGYTDRLETIKTYEEDESAASRLHFWQVALQMSAALPLGVGVQNFNAVYDRFDFSEGRYGQNRSVHNSHLQILTEAGMAGFAAWLFALGYAIWITLRVRKRQRVRPTAEGAILVPLGDGIVAAFAAFIVGGTFTAIGWNDFVWCLFGVTAALDRVSLAASRKAIIDPAPQSKPGSHGSSKVLQGWVPRHRRVAPGLRKRVS